MPTGYACYQNGKWTDDARRKDVKQSYSNAPIAEILHGPPLDNYAGLASADRRPRQIVETEQGPISIPTGPTGDPTQMPSVAQLRSAYSSDTRRTAISDRYYR